MNKTKRLTKNDIDESMKVTRSRYTDSANDVHNIDRDSQLITHKGNCRDEDNERLIRARLRHHTAEFIKSNYHGCNRTYYGTIKTEQYQRFCDLTDQIEAELKANADTN